MNKVILMGRLVADPELRTTPNGVSVTSFTLAVNRRFAKQGDPVTADFIDIVAWRQTADFIAKWFSKGRQIAVIGSIQVRKWQDKEGKNRYTTEVVAEEAYFADSKKEGAEGSFNNAPFGNAAGNNTGASGAGYTPAGRGDFDEVDDGDELPF